MAQNLLAYLGIKNPGNIFYHLSVSELIEHTIRNQLGTLADNGALVVSTGEFTGRSPKDKFVVKDEETESKVWWGDINQPFDPEDFDRLYLRLTAYLQNRDLYVRDVYACADPRYRLKIRVVNEYPWANLFVNHLFIRPSKEELNQFQPDWTILAIPSFFADPTIDKTRQHNFTIIHFSRRLVLIGGSAYTGEIKKSIFTVLNYLLPLQQVLSMHCSANMGKEGDVALFFGLSGTGKTTLSSDPERRLIGDDEHGWSDTGIFNFEGGCYAKVIRLSKEKEPQIWNAIRYGTLLENVLYHPNTRDVDFHNKQITENTRAAYPISYIDNAVEPSVGGTPKNIFFLTADAFGVLPPIARLTREQAMYYFISGYTSKVAGTEVGVTDPVVTFSACFGAPFLPLHPGNYARLLGEKLKQYPVNVWLVNTGWIRGPFGVGHRIDIPHTRAIIKAALSGKLDNVEYEEDPIFGLRIPKTVPNVPSDILFPRNAWADPNAFDIQANKLAKMFVDNFKKFSSEMSEEIRAAGPKVREQVS